MQADQLMLEFDYARPQKLIVARVVQAYNQAAPVVKDVTETAAPYVKKTLETAGELAKPVVKAAEPALKVK